MSERDDDEKLDAEAERLSPAAERARAALHAAPPAPADREFRDRLKQAFVSGAIEVTGTRERRLRQDGDARPGAVRIGTGRTGGGSVAVFPRRRRFPTVAWVAASLAAAAALIVVFGALNRGPTWWVTAARGDGSVRVDGQNVALDDRDAMRRLLVPGAEIEMVGNAELDVCSDGVVSLQLTPGTKMTLPPPPARWVGRRTELFARSGVVRVTTGRNFPGARLAVMSPTAAVEVKGTTLAVIIEDVGTCVCVEDGTAMVGRRVGAGDQATDMRPVAGGHLRYIYNDHATDLHEIRGEEHVKLVSFRESQRPWLMGTATPE
ncbi:MAG: hypothetical protein ACM3PF_06865 [Bacteroidota bacterium]